LDIVKGVSSRAGAVVHGSLVLVDGLAKAGAGSFIGMNQIVSTIYIQNNLSCE